MTWIKHITKTNPNPCNLRQSVFYFLLLENAE